MKVVETQTQLLLFVLYLHSIISMPIRYKFIIAQGRNRILVLFNYDAPITARLKQPTDVRWSKTHKGWHIADPT